MRFVLRPRYWLGFLLLFPLGNCFATLLPSITLAWNATSSPDIAGYRLYSGVTSGGYTSVLDCQGNTTGTISNLVPGTVYFFAVTAYTFSGLESAFSTELSYALPPVTSSGVRVAMVTSPGGQLLVSANALPGTVFDLLVSTDLQSWSTQTSLTADLGGLVQFTDPGPRSNPAKFYRLKQTSP